MQGKFRSVSKVALKDWLYNFQIGRFQLRFWISLHHLWPAGQKWNTNPQEKQPSQPSYAYLNSFGMLEDGWLHG